MKSGLASLALVLLAAPLTAQEGGGVTGAVVLQLPAGGRAAALSGAYTAAHGDPDVLFYNPAGLRTIDAAASLSYQRHVADIGAASVAGAMTIGRVAVGVGVAFLDAGDIAVVEPDPTYGGQTGTETGAHVGASEVAARVGAALPLGADLTVGASAGLVSVSLAESTRTAATFDVGAQYALPFVTLGAAVRNIGGSLNGAGLADAPLPTEARIGAVVDWQRADGWGASMSADIVSALEEKTTGVLLGVEGGLVPGSAARVSAVARLGFDARQGGDRLGALRIGAGVALAGFGVDYAYQDFDAFGGVHRVGLRWSR
jgi:hypothetical protein